jgi:hypothetical protein
LRTKSILDRKIQDGHPPKSLVGSRKVRSPL